MRWELMSALATLADRGHQARHWTDPSDREIDDVVRCLFDDVANLPDPASRLGSVLIDRDEVDSLVMLGTSLGQVLDALGDVGSSAFAAHADWPEVVERAADALAVLARNGGIELASLDDARDSWSGGSTVHATPSESVFASSHAEHRVPWRVSGELVAWINGPAYEPNDEVAARLADRLFAAESELLDGRTIDLEEVLDVDGVPSRVGASIRWWLQRCDVSADALMYLAVAITEQEELRYSISGLVGHIATAHEEVGRLAPLLVGRDLAAANEQEVQKLFDLHLELHQGAAPSGVLRGYPEVDPVDDRDMGPPVR